MKTRSGPKHDSKGLLKSFSTGILIMESGKPETSSKIIPDRQKLEYCAKVLLTNTFIELPSNTRSEIYKLESYLVQTNVSSFKLDVKGKKYEPPQFLKFDRISDEDCVHEALNINILRSLNLAGCHHELKEEYIHHITFPSMIGEPEFTWFMRRDAKILYINDTFNIGEQLTLLQAFDYIKFLVHKNPTASTPPSTHQSRTGLDGFSLTGVIQKSVKYSIVGGGDFSRSILF
nr:4829_t:CDS:2 [Entrophospora candida]